MQGFHHIFPINDKEGSKFTLEYQVLSEHKETISHSFPLCHLVFRYKCFIEFFFDYTSIMFKHINIICSTLWFGLGFVVKGKGQFSKILIILSLTWHSIRLSIHQYSFTNLLLKCLTKQRWVQLLLKVIDYNYNYFQM